MNKKAFYGIIIAAIVPIACYFVVKGFSDRNDYMPHHFLADSTVTTVRKGKEYTDTQWHKVPSFPLKNQQGQDVSLSQLKGKVIVADFFFTHCPTICPALTSNMRRLQSTITNSQRVGNKTPDFLHFVSFSIDPERDSVERLKYWANRFQVNPEQWWLVTGDKKQIYDMAIHELKLGLTDGQGIDTNFIHTDHFVLIDSNMHVRGYYHGLDTADLARLSRDIIFLSMEKDPNRKNFLAGQLPVMAAAFIAAFVGVGILFFVFRKQRRYADSSVEKERP
ncbi:MAG: SCO family protein [Chitinophagaceae bacterium]|nr:MAG: SCO family protein [Chitinophagaceae bacterium]